MTPTTSPTLAALNDRFRQAITDPTMTTPTLPGRLLLSPEIHALSPISQRLLLLRVRTFADFPPDHDPHGAHDAGSFPFHPHPITWSIHGATAPLEYGNDHPLDLAHPHRILTIRFSHEDSHLPFLTTQRERSATWRRD